MRSSRIAFPETVAALAKALGVRTSELIARAERG
jgi:hypothetical protein